MKIKHKKYSFLLLISLLLIHSTARSQAASTNDSGKIFSLQDLEQVVFANHPIVKQAALLSQSAKSKVLQSLGKFDPAVKAAFDRKDFGHTRYYNNWHSELKVPLWLAGADLKIGYDRYTGTYTDPEKHTPDDGLTSVGLSIPIGQGFIIDERRNTLKQSRLMVQYAEAEKVKQILSVWYSAVQSYWNWYYSYSQYLLIREGVDLAQKRFEAVSAQTLIGDKPAIDSVEASITVQDRRIQLAKMEVELRNARLLLSNYLWNENEDPLELPPNALPQDATANLSRADQLQIDSLVELAADQHPDLLKLRSKSAQLGIERRFRREMLKPKLNLTGALITGRNTFGDYYPKYYDINWGNYKIGMDFAIPLFLRSERGKLREVNIKLQEVDYDLQQTGREIRNNILTSYNSLQAYENQLDLQTVNINKQQTLLSAELQKFDLGESTLFVINSRETKLIDMKIKKAEMISGYQKKVAEIYYKAGTRQDVGLTD